MLAAEQIQQLAKLRQLMMPDQRTERLHG